MTYSKMVTPRQYANITKQPYDKVKRALHKGVVPNAIKINGRWMIGIDNGDSK